MNIRLVEIVIKFAENDPFFYGLIISHFNLLYIYIHTFIFFFLIFFYLIFIFSLLLNIDNTKLRIDQICIVNLYNWIRNFLEDGYQQFSFFFLVHLNKIKNI